VVALLFAKVTKVHMRKNNDVSQKGRLSTQKREEPFSSKGEKRGFSFARAPPKEARLLLKREWPRTQEVEAKGTIKMAPPDC